MKGPHILIVPLALYVMVARLVLAVPNVWVHLGHFPQASEVVTVAGVRSSNVTCQKDAGVDLVGYSEFSFDLCVPQALAATLQPGDKLRVEGKAYARRPAGAGPGQAVSESSCHSPTSAPGSEMGCSLSLRQK